MDYKEKYKQALEIARVVNPGTKDYNIVTTIFPELKENEDERIRKAIKEAVEHYWSDDTQARTDISAWLEKQGEKFIPEDINEAALQYVDTCTVDGEITHDNVTEPYWNNHSMMNAYKAGWLEKQGEQKESRKASVWKHWKDGIAGNGEGKLVYLIKSGNTYRLSSCLGFECDYIELSDLDKLYAEKQGEQKSVECIGCNNFKGCITCTDGDQYAHITEQKPDDKVEPKFKVGDWVVSPNGIYWHIDSIRDSRYQVSSDSGNCADWPLNTNIYHKFTIQDAKDGDVLEFVDHGRIVIGIVNYVNKVTGKVDVRCLLENNNFMSGNFYALDTINPHPATKEQRDILLSKMKEAGYEWDAEKKELKKIEQKNTDNDIKEALHTEYDKGRADVISEMQKSAWSKEDDKMWSQVINEIEAIKSNSSTIFEKNIAQEKIDWLNSIKERYTWKPSDEQMKQLGWVAEQNKDNMIGKELMSLYQDLKKLREE